MSLSTTFAAPFYDGAARLLEVPGKWDVALAGRGYMIDTARTDQFGRGGIPLLRDQADNSGAFGEQTLSPEELWRRSQDSWDHGAGQVHLDRRDSDNRRFRSSKGVNVWERWELSLLNDTVLSRGSANTNLQLAVAGGFLYATDGAALVYTTNLTAFTAVTGLPTAPTSITSDGFTVFTAQGASGVWSTTRGAATATSYATGTVSLVGYVKGRLMAAQGPSLYNIVAAGPLPAALFTHPNTDFTWVGFAEGQTALYAAGFSGDKSLIYRTTIKPDGTALDAPIIAGELPDGEIVRSITGYLSFVVLGTDSGVRFCATDGQGNLTIGSLIRTSSPVLCFEGQDRFVWFGWSAYDAASTGLGRLDLSEFVAPLTPAYASDLMANGQGAVSSIATFLGRRVFAVQGQGFYDETTTKVASGTLDTGLISYGLPDLKTAIYLDVKVRTPVDTNRAYLSVDSGAFALVGTRNSAVVDPFTVGEKSGETFEVRHELINDNPLDATGPVITRFTLRSNPRPAQGEVFTIPILLWTSVQTRQDTQYLDPEQEFAALVSLRESKRLVTLQLGHQSHTVFVDAAQFSYEERDDLGVWSGTALLRLKSPAN